MLEEYHRIFCNARLCHRIDIEQCGQIFNLLKPSLKQYKKGEIIFAEGAKQQYFGLIAKGEVLQSRIKPDGERALFGQLKEGQLFGEIMMFLDGYSNWRCDVIAKTACNIVLFNTDAFFEDEFLNSNVSGLLFFNFLRLVCERYEFSQMLLRSLKTKSVRHKIANYIYEKYLNEGKTEFRLGMALFEMAEYLNLPRPSLSRELSAMKADGIIRYSKDRFVICDLKALENCMYE